MSNPTERLGDVVAELVEIKLLLQTLVSRFVPTTTLAEIDAQSVPSPPPVLGDWTNRSVREPPEPRKVVPDYPRRKALPYRTQPHSQ